MLYFATPSGPKAQAAMTAGLLGCIDTPRQGNKRPPGVTWCADNGCYTEKHWTEQAWWSFLERNAHDAAACRFATLPDVVADARATWARSEPHVDAVRALGYPAALVAQDGLEDLEIPWDAFDALFIGGSTEWKLGTIARDLCHEAKARGKWVHVGRINTARRYAYAATPYATGGMGADSCDGTKLRYGPNKNLPHLLEFTDRSLLA